LPFGSKRALLFDDWLGDRLRLFRVFFPKAKNLSSRMDFLLDGFELIRSTFFPKM
jgi:hypothetical protein